MKMLVIHSQNRNTDPDLTFVPAPSGDLEIRASDAGSNGRVIGTVPKKDVPRLAHFLATGEVTE